MCTEEFEPGQKLSALKDKSEPQFETLDVQMNKWKTQCHPGVNRGLPLPPIQVVGRPLLPRAAHLHWVLLELAVFTLTEEVMFYYMHWLFHHPIFYKKIPKRHHEWTAPIGTISLHVLPLERSVQPV
ncbi:Fatty Acid Hydroxylase Domain-Containing Protein 2 [Manis pentadactyla]|nr:Fatty Acid Hydroxylase Domain-Containing Protein 2 [Manis pentadactyla]